MQHQPGLFAVLRVLADRPRRSARFLVLGSASPDLLRQTSETLAGRIVYHELDGLGLDEVGVERHARLWLRGGLLPWHENLSKRQVKSPKVYITDSGLLHALLGLSARLDLDAHPKLGASWEGFGPRSCLARGACWSGRTTHLVRAHPDHVETCA